MNYTIQALDLINKQLHATSTMALKNRFILDTMRAPDDGVCAFFKEDWFSWLSNGQMR